MEIVKKVTNYNSYIRIIMSQTIVKVNQLKLISILVFDECKILESKSENDR